MSETEEMMPDSQIQLKEDPTPRDIAEYMVRVLDAKRGRDIKLLYVENRTIIADYFVLCTGASATQVSSLSDEVEYRLSEYGIAPLHIEGKRGDGWILTDYGSVLLHVFSGEQRDFYKLEKLYDEGSEQDISGLLTAD